MCARRLWLATIAVALAALAGCSEPPAKSFVKTAVRVFAIAHVRVIDGTGAPARDDQTVVVRDGRIGAVGSALSVNVPPGASVIDGRGRTVIPGLVAMHEHLFYGLDHILYPAAAAFARLYLASGVTTIRTAGAIDVYEDLRIKQAIDEGRLPGPKVRVTSPYFGEMDPASVPGLVASLADDGVTSFKAYMTMRAPELKALIDAAHARGLRVTGHLCAVGFRDAAAMGIDNLEHGLFVDSEFFRAKEPDVCPDQGQYQNELSWIDPATDRDVHQLVQDLVRHGVAITSTLAVLESMTGDPDVYDPRMPAVLTTRLRRVYDGQLPEESDRYSRGWAKIMSSLLSHEMQFERMFVAADGHLLAGSDPTGWGGIVAGFADQRELELLVEAGFKPEAAVRIATSNGADFLNESDQIGTVEAGRQADLVLVRGNPAVRISDVRNIETVFKDGVGYDSEALIAASAGTVGEYYFRILLHWPFSLVWLPIAALLARLAFKIRRSLTRSDAAETRARPAVRPVRTPLQG
jgi:imidazolonepropionase-like amidohydrolase